MLTVVTGRADSLISDWVFPVMKERGSDRSQVLLVPEHASFEAERRLAEENGNAAGRYSEVLSFTRLENRVLSVTGGAADAVMDEGGRLLTMYAAVRSVAEHLTVYQMPSRRPEFLTGLLTTLNELKSCCVSTDLLQQVGEETEGPDGEKLRDLALIFSAYDAMTSRSALDPRDRLSRLAEKLKGGAWASGRDIYLTGFTDFTPQQMLVLEQLLRHAESLTLVLVCDGRTGSAPQFEPARRTILQLQRMAKRMGIPDREIRLEDGARKLPEGLAVLERELFSETAPQPCLQQEAVSVTVCPDPREEVRWTAREIRRLVQQGTVRFRDIAVAARNMERYREHIELCFPEFGIPVFRSEMTDILQKPIFALIISAMETVNGGYLYEDVFRYLKTGLTGITQDECDRLENYVLTWDIHGRGWTAAKGWTMHPQGFAREFRDGDRAVLEELNALRLRVTAPLENLRSRAGNTIREQVMALYEFLEEAEVPERLQERTDRLREKGEQELAAEYEQLWEIFCNALEQCVRILGDTEGDFARFSSLLRMLLSCYRVGSIPASLDRVMAGDPQRLMGRRPKVLFFLGMDDSQIPSLTPGSGLLTDRDRELLEEYGMELGHAPEDKYSREQALIYGALTLPSQKLVLTRPDHDGNAECRDAYPVRRVRDLFPDAERSYDCPVSPASLRAKAVRMQSGNGPEDPRQVLLRQRLERAAVWERGRLSRPVVQSLYGDQVRMSASRMDKFKSCHFAYFMQFGLQASARRRAGLDAPAYGDFIHYVLQHVLMEVKDRGGIGQVTDEQLHEAADRIVEEYIRLRLGGMENKTPRFRYLFRRLRKNVRAIVKNVTDELRSSDFQPLAFELGFGTGEDHRLDAVTVTSGGVTLRVTGLVDRVDGWEKDGRLYLRVVDYKTGRKSFDFTEVWNGLGLQMLLYLFTLQEKGESVFHRPVESAGALYLPARDVYVDGDREMDESARQKEVDRQLRRDGILLDSEEILMAMEQTEKDFRFLPIRLVKKTEKLTGDKLVTAEQLGRLSKHTDAVLRQICDEIAAGNISADPYWRGPQKNACLYCEYRQACQFEERTDRKRYLASMKSDEFWEKMQRKEDA